MTLTMLTVLAVVCIILVWSLAKSVAEIDDLKDHLKRKSKDHEQELTAKDNINQNLRYDVDHLRCEMTDLRFNFEKEIESKDAVIKFHRDAETDLANRLHKLQAEQQKLQEHNFTLTEVGTKAVAILKEVMEKIDVPNS